MKNLPLLFVLTTSITMAGPINLECENNPTDSNKDCPSDPLHTEAYEMDYMNFGYAWDKSYGTARVTIIDRQITSSLAYNDEIGSRFMRHNSGTYFPHRWGSTNNDLPNCTYTTNQAPSSNSYILNDNKTIGSLNYKQTTLKNFPNIFINEYHPSSQGVMDLEIGIKFLNPNNITLLIEGNPIEYNLANDFTLGDTNNGYNLYYKLSIPALTSDTFLTNDIRIFNNGVEVLNGSLSGTPYYYQDCLFFNPGLTDVTGMGPGRHGDLILGLYGSKTDNGVGHSSVCRECMVSIASIYNYNVSSNFNPTEYNQKVSGYYLAIKNAIEQGAQIINHSGFLGAPGTPKCEDQNPELEACYLLDLIKSRDIIYIASNGNQKGLNPNWPANENDHVIGVGGTDSIGRIWDETNDGGSCPLSDTEECGSQFLTNSTDINIMAPAQDILVYHGNGSYNPLIGCVDGYLGAGNEGYQFCSGTSFAAPIIGGVVAIMRTLNPLLSFDEIKDTLANSRVFSDGTTSYSIPNIASIMKKNILGFSNNQRVANRVKPMFRLKHQRFDTSASAYRNSYLSTTIPQVALAAKNGTYMASVDNVTGEIEVPEKVFFNYDNSAPLAVGYPSLAFGIAQNTYSPFYIFGGHENPFTGADDMVPLYHFAYRKVNYPGCNANTDHGYATDLVNEFATNNYLKCSTTFTGKFYNEGIEGYLLPDCPIAGGCYEDNNNPTAPQCLRIRYSATDQSHAVYMESEQNGKFSTYTTRLDDTGVNSEDYRGLENSECLGYVFPNVDSDNDLVIDGMELVLGTDINDVDSDDDGFSDGSEYPPASNYVSDPLIFTEGCESCDREKIRN